MLNKQQKKAYVALGVDLSKGAQTLAFVDFTGVSVTHFSRFKREIKKASGTVKVMKKRLLKIALKEAGIDFDPTQFEKQLATVFVPDDVSAVASIIFKFNQEMQKAGTAFAMLGAYSITDKSFIDVKEFTAIAKLPTREVLLSMVLGAATGPLRAFMYLLLEIAKKQGTSAPEPEKVTT